MNTSSEIANKYADHVLADALRREIESYAKEHTEQVECKTCNATFHIEGTVLHWKTGRRQCIKCYTKEHAIAFVIWSDSEECLIALDANPDIPGEHIEEKCYRLWNPE